MNYVLDTLVRRMCAWKYSWLRRLSRLRKLSSSATVVHGNFWHLLADCATYIGFVGRVGVYMCAVDDW